MVAAYLNRVVTAVPNNDMHQRFIDCVPLMIRDECSRALFRRMVSRAQIERREKPRTDGFFDRDITGRSKADEIAEALLISDQREHEERKLPHLANLLGFIAFESRIDVSTANHIIKIASSFSYRQYCILALAVNATPWRIHSPPFGDSQNAATQIWTLLIEIFDLFRLQLVGFGGGYITEVTEMPLERL